MDRVPFIISQCAQDLSQDDMGSQRSLSSIVGRFHSWVNDKREPVLESVPDFADELLNLLDRVLFHGPVIERFSRQMP